MATSTKPSILFVSESVTLAHFARPFQLSNQLATTDYTLHFACDKRYQAFLAASTHTLHTISSISAEQFKQALAQGDPLYDFTTLNNYVEADLALIDDVKPDLIIGDFRLSLAVSARLAKIPYATITNAYWSPYAPKHYPVPCLPVTQYFGVTLGSWLFNLVAPLAFKYHALALHKLRRHFGLPKTALDLRQAYTDADYTLYADIPSLFPLINPPDNHLFIGPILWSPPVTAPEWWQQLPTDRPIIYVSMGSSGSSQALQTVLNALSRAEVTVIVASAGANVSLPPTGNIFLADYLDGTAAAQRADFVICNGGSLACQQAFAQGKAVIGIATNMDQFLNMAGVSRAKAGLVLRSDNLTETNLLNTYRRVLHNTVLSDNVACLQQEIEGLLSEKRLVQLIKTVVNYNRYLDKFIEFAGDISPEDITDNMFREYRLFLNRQTIKQNIILFIFFPLPH